MSKRQPTTVQITGATPNVDDLDELRTDKQAAFVREYVKDWNASQAAIRAGYSEATAGQIGHALLKKVEVQDAIERRMAAVFAVAEVDAAMVVRELYEVATADPRDLMRVEIDCCRYCYGISHRYQYTPAEFDRALVEALRVGAPAPELAGGICYNAKLPPVEDCPECFGRGLERVVVTDSRKLSKAAAKLMASVKQSSKDGAIEGKTRDQDAALIALGRYLGMWKDRNEISGVGGGPLQVQPVRPAHQLTNAELEEALRASGHLQGPITEAQIDRILGDTK
jgi:phage terminase small subunit